MEQPTRINSTTNKKHVQQECIPLGCVPPAAVTVHGWSASVHAMIHPPGVGLETPPGVDLETLPGVGLETSPACGPGDPPWPDPSTSPLGVGLETPPGDLQSMLEYHLHAGISPPPMR